MNTYRITYSIGGPETDTTELIERSEQAARKAFKVFCKSGTITDIALTRTGVAATKQQERDTLAAIRQMVEELGPDSYVATALEGCFEIAEWNIDSDAADSLKGRLEMAEEKIAQGVEELQQARKDLGEARADAERLKIANDELAFRLPAADDLTDCIALAKDRASEHEQQMADAAARIVELAGDPTSPEFRQAVTDHRNAQSALDYYKAIQGRLSNIAAGA